MARAGLQKVYADFRQGFVTVANPLSYPEGSLKDIVNFDIQDNGTLRLRPGLRQESTVVVDTQVPYEELAQVAVSSFVWSNVNNRGDEKIAVIQVGTYILLYPIYKDRIALDQELAKIDLAIPSDTRGTEISGTSGAGWFFIVHPGIRTKILKKDITTGVFSLEEVDIKIRDLSLWRGDNDRQTGLESSNDLFPMHIYNLQNGGWPASTVVSKETNADNGTTTADPIRYYKSKRGNYPPVYIPFSLGKAGGGDTLSEQNAFSPWAINEQYFGNTLIPLGRNIVSAELWSRRGQGDTPFDPALPVTESLERFYEWSSYPSATEFYAGRVWYSGAKGYGEYDSPVVSSYTKKDNLDVSNTIYFSQLLDSDMEKAGMCHSSNDPTAEDFNSLLSTDGGTVTIRGAGTILSMKTFGTSLIVFATEGVWAISGIDVNSFTADSYSVNRLSNIGPTSVYTITATNKDIYYIANDAIYTLTSDEISGQPSAVDITSDRIKDFYNKIPFSQKEKSKAFFDTTNRNLYVLYADSAVAGSNLYNKVLVFNKDLGCFYKYNLGSTEKSIFDGLFYAKDVVSQVLTGITVDGIAVTLDDVPVTLETVFSTASSNTLQLLTVEDVSGNIGVSFSSFSDTDKFEDWGQGYQGIVEFGFDTAGDIMRDSLKAPVIISHLERTEDGFELDPLEPLGGFVAKHPSSCFMTYGWDWATSYKGGTELYRLNRNYIPYGLGDPFDYGKSIITCRNRIRGKGHSLGIRLTSGFGFDCRLLGLGIMYTASKDI
jgi:hypothetical protein